MAVAERWPIAETLIISRIAAVERDHIGVCRYSYTGWCLFCRDWKGEYPNDENDRCDGEMHDGSVYVVMDWCLC
jgi:hypothetical protein